jgi:hypothetical protein
MRKRVQVQTTTTHNVCSAVITQACSITPVVVTVYIHICLCTLCISAQQFACKRAALQFNHNRYRCTTDCTVLLLQLSSLLKTPAVASSTAPCVVKNGDIASDTEQCCSQLVCTVRYCAYVWSVLMLCSAGCVLEQLQSGKSLVAQKEEPVV